MTPKDTLAAAGVGYSAVGTWLDFAQPFVAVFAGLAGGVWACIQIYAWFKKRRS